MLVISSYEFIYIDCRIFNRNFYYIFNLNNNINVMKLKNSNNNNNRTKTKMIIHRNTKIQNNKIVI